MDAANEARRAVASGGSSVVGGGGCDYSGRAKRVNSSQRAQSKDCAGVCAAPAGALPLAQGRSESGARMTACGRNLSRLASLAGRVAELSLGHDAPLRDCDRKGQRIIFFTIFSTIIYNIIINIIYLRT